MRDKYPYLRDPRALAEIRKHKWIESQKAGIEIGFATAAVDWVKKHGEAWKRIHAQEYRDQEIFIERRKYRRFKLKGIVQIISDGLSVVAEPLDLSFFGILCRTNKRVSLGDKTRARISFISQQHKKDLDCDGRIERIVPIDAHRFDLFFSFHESCQDALNKALVI